MSVQRRIVIQPRDFEVPTFGNEQLDVSSFVFPKGRTLSFIRFIGLGFGPFGLGFRVSLELLNRDQPDMACLDDLMASFEVGESLFELVLARMHAPLMHANVQNFHKIPSPTTSRRKR
jgi:hypothetical protein